MKLHKKVLCTAGVVVLLGSSNLFAEDQSARDILNRAYEYIGNMDSYSFQAVVSEDRIENESSIAKTKQEVSVKLDRPGSLRVDTNGDIKNRSTYIHNGSFTMIDHGFDYYAQFETPKTIDGALDFIFEKYGIRAPLASLLYSDMPKRAKFIKSKNFGTMMVGGTECDYVAFSNTKREVHAWIATGDKPLVKTYSIIDRTGKESFRRNTSFIWNTNANISERDFVFKAPKGASKISVNSTN